MKNILFILLSIFCLNSFGQTHTVNDTTVTRYLRAKSGGKLHLMHPLVFLDSSEQQSGVTNTLFSNWNSAYNLSHSHANLSLLSSIKASDTTRWASGGGGVTPTDNLLHWDSENSWYTFYSTSQAGKFDNSNTNPSDLTNRCNWNGIFYASRVLSYSTNGDALYGYSTNGYGIDGESLKGLAGWFNQTGTPTSNITNNVVSIIRNHSSGTSYNITGNLLNISDSPSTTGTISGSLIKGVIGTSERLRFDPRVKGNADSTAFIFDTHRQLLSTDTLFTIKNIGSNKFQVLYDGSVYSKGSIFKQGTDTLATQAYARAHGSSGGGGTVTSVSITTANGISGTVANATTTPGITILPDTVNKYKTHTQSNADTVKLHNQLALLLPDSVAYNTAFPFNKTLTYMSHTLTANDVITINSTGAINQGGGQILFTNNTSYTPVLTAFKNIGVYNNTYTYSLCTFIKVHGLYIVSILNFN